METTAVNPFGKTGETAAQQGAVTGLAENFDNFLTILTTQLQNQDPLSPMDTNEFTNQLVMFADVEQSVRQSGQLDELIALNRSNEALGAVSYIGKTVRANGNEFMLGDDPVSLSYQLPEAADAAALQIYDEAGTLVFVEPAPTEFGDHTIEWDGKDVNGQALPAGVYSFQIGAVGPEEQTIEASYSVSSLVTGVDYAPDGTILKLGDVSIPLSRVLSVEETAGG
ncbi:MAG: flagellar hook assembly protein FlgD [Alphaproteobacteria bacterium]|nr:flagellar hook assembly protein FlgD [Alphaproteobacteria bacterium]